MTATAYSVGAPSSWFDLSLPPGSGGLTPLDDVRTYDTDVTTGAGAGSSGFTTLTKPGSSLYERLVAATPGLSNWWTLDHFDVVTPGVSAFRPSAGATTLQHANGGSLTTVAGILPSAGHAAALSGGAFLEALDYWPFMGSSEVGSVELWVKLSAFPSDSGLVSNWGGSAGWLLGLNDSDGSVFLMVAGQKNIVVSAALALDTLYHIVGVIGGTQNDYTSRLYVNGVDVHNGSFTSAVWLQTDNAHFNIGTYNNGRFGADEAAGSFQHVALYSRMLQPAEVLQHYQAGIAA